MGEVQTGKLKWFNEDKGYGFIKPDSGSQDIFIHISEIEKAGYKTLNVDNRISYTIKNNKGKVSAIDIQLI